MKIRNVVFGYCYKDGELIIHPTEFKVVQDIFNEYVNGKTLLEIATTLKNRKVEYLPNQYEWNKTRVMRIIENEHYLGDEKYPSIISQTLYNKANETKQSKSRQNRLDNKDSQFKIPIPIKCAKCNSIMFRRIDSRQKNPIRWVCKSKDCDVSIPISDNEFQKRITETLNYIIANPNMIVIPSKTLNEKDNNLFKVNNEIVNLMESKAIDRKKVREKLLEYTMLKYNEIRSEMYISQYLKDTFAEAVQTDELCLPLLNRTVYEIKLYLDKTIGVVLENYQEIKIGGNDANGNGRT